MDISTTVDQRSDLSEAESDCEKDSFVEQNPEKESVTLIENDQIPINTTVALAKESVLTKFFFGDATIAACDFIDAGLDSILMNQLADLDDPKSGQHLVQGFLANYVNWASVAKMHTVKSQNKVSVPDPCI